MKDDDNEQEKPEEKQISSSNLKDSIFQRLKDKGIKVIDDTKEWEGKTTIFTTNRPPQKTQKGE